ncbi:MAG: adenine deaminase [Bacteroidales bacterium]|jgi:adenine deaminase|nr:adenine deaminase [Bacteroidales bacterium]
MNKEFIISGKIVDIIERRIFNATIKVTNSKIVEIQESTQENDNYIIPGFIDAHVHIESSMLIPTSFARAAVKNGTVATVSDPHEIANVLGVDGVKFMIKNGKKSPFKFYFGAPSCVPATSFETSGAVIDSADIKELMANPDIHYLAEMMNFPGVIFQDEEVLKKIKYAHDSNKPVDGHAPGLFGEDLNKYAAQKITTDHECTSVKEAIEKINRGIKIQIREGSAAKNFENLFPLIESHPAKVMFCTDDCHPDDLVKGHINKVVSRAIGKGADVFDVISAATKIPKEHYNLDVGLLQVGDPADFIIVNNLCDFDVSKTYINGDLVYENGVVLIEKQSETSPNNFNCKPISISDILVPERGKSIQVIVAKDGDLVTGKEIIEPTIKDGHIVSDINKDILKIVIVNRYKNTKPQVGFIKNFKLKKGAIAGSIAHDSHNIIAIGTNDIEIVNAINTVIDNKGGIVAYDENKLKQLKLEVAGLMSTGEAEDVAKRYHEVHSMAKELGSELTAPFMTMAFMALLVIPELKIGDKGMFDVTKFAFTSLFIE